MKWVIADAGTNYEVGDFNGKSWKGGGAVDGNGRAGLYQLAFRLEETNIPPANLPLSGGNTPPVEWGVVANRRTGEF